MKRIRQKMDGKALPAVFFTVFLDVLGIGILLPILPLLVLPGPERILPEYWSVGDGFILLGFLAAIYPFMQFFAAPILGRLSDRYGRKPVLAVSLLGTALGYALFAYAILTKNIPLLFAARALDGITGGNISVAQAVIADVTTPENRTKNFGRIGAVFGLGFIMGPYIGSKLAAPDISFYGLFSTPSWFNAATPFWFAAILSIINVIAILLLLPETHKNINKLKQLDAAKSVHNIAKALKYPGLRVIFPTLFLYFAGFTLFTTFFQVGLADKLDYSPSNIGDYFAYVGIWIAITQVFITPFIARRFKNFQVLRFSMAGTGLALFTLALASNTLELLLITPLFSILNGQTMANSISLISSSAGKEIQGEVLGINASVQALAQSIPAALSGYMAAVGVGLPIFAGGGLMVLSGVIFWLLYKPASTVVHATSK